MARTEGIGSRQRPQALEGSVQFTTELEGVETLIERFEVGAHRVGEDAGGAEALIGGLGAIVDAVDPGAVAALGQELFDRLKEIDVQAGQLIDAGELRVGGVRGEAIVADELADDGAVLLLDVSAVVFLPGAAAGEGDAMLPAVGIEVLVDELAAVVAVEAHEWHGQSRADAMNAAADALLAFAPDRFELDPGRGDIDGTEGGEIEALGARGTVGNEI